MSSLLAERLQITHSGLWAKLDVVYVDQTSNTGESPIFKNEIIQRQVDERTYEGLLLGLDEIKEAGVELSGVVGDDMLAALRTLADDCGEVLLAYSPGGTTDLLLTPVSGGSNDMTRAWAVVADDEGLLSMVYLCQDEANTGGQIFTYNPRSSYNLHPGGFNDLEIVRADGTEVASPLTVVNGEYMQVTQLSGIGSNNVTSLGRVVVCGTFRGKDGDNYFPAKPRRSSVD